VVIIGGSHSAISSANKLLSLEIQFKDASIKLFHRSPLYVTFESSEEAKKLGFTDFNEEDNYPPLYDGLSGEKIRLNAPNFVNENSELLDSDSQKVPNCYALGLASNYNLAGRFTRPWAYKYKNLILKF